MSRATATEALSHAGHTLREVSAFSLNNVRIAVAVLETRHASSSGLPGTHQTDPSLRMASTSGQACVDLRIYSIRIWSGGVGSSAVKIGDCEEFPADRGGELLG